MKQFALISLLSFIACDSVHTTAIEARSLVSVTAEWSQDLSALKEQAGISTETPLRATLVWAGVPNFSPFCLQQGPNPLEPDRVVTSSVAKLACPDPFRFVPSITQGAVVLEGSENQVTIELANLPPTEALVGTPSSRVAYAAVVVYADQNNNGILDQESRCKRAERDGKSGERFDDPVEPILASSFSYLAKPHERLVYREGDFDAESYFYPAPTCEAPPPVGFSIWRVDFDDCSNADLNQRIRLNPGQPEDFFEMQCGPGRKDFAREPRDKEPDQRVIRECLSENEMATADPTCECPDPVVYKLKGCERDFFCEEPEWDLTENPPAWWPCFEDDN